MLSVNHNWRKIEKSELIAPIGLIKNPTIILFICVLSLFYTSSVLFFGGVLPWQYVITINSVCLYAIYTVTHEAIHDIAHQNKRINYMLGFVCAAHEGITFPLLKLIHPQHHLYTNDPEKDPDYVIGRKPRWALPLWMLIRMTHDNFFMIKRKLWHGEKLHLLMHLVTLSLQAGVIFYFYHHGLGEEIIIVWVAPLIIGGLSVELTVAWLTHYPHESQDTFKHTRMFHGLFPQLLMLNQNYHFVHHLWPKLPWFKYQKYRKIVELGRKEQLINRKKN